VFEHFALPVGECSQFWLRLRHWRGQPAQHPAGNGRGHGCPAFVNLPNGIKQPRWVGMFEQITVCPGTQGRKHPHVVIKNGQHQYRHRQTSLPDLRHSLNARQPRHINIHQHHVGRVGLNMRHRVERTSKITDHRKTGGAANE